MKLKLSAILILSIVSLFCFTACDPFGAMKCRDGKFYDYTCGESCVAPYEYMCGYRDKYDDELFWEYSMNPNDADWNPKSKVYYCDGNKAKTLNMNCKEYVESVWKQQEEAAAAKQQIQESEQQPSEPQPENPEQN